MYMSHRLESEKVILSILTDKTCEDICIYL